MIFKKKKKMKKMTFDEMREIVKGAKTHQFA